jgi:hypothetical protein
MGGWADGVRTKELGTGLLADTVWIGYRQSMSGESTTLSIQTADQQVWTLLDVSAWRELIAEAENAISFLEHADDESEEQEPRP